ncbi:hypothetical protein NE865_15586 [Phthorimaea operculella]|nr:hypothetical protein NE865_15586 [Phthorimaea operculella]
MGAIAHGWYSKDEPNRIDTGGGFLLEDEEVSARDSRPVSVSAPPAPLQPHEQPDCLECERRFATSYLLDTFDYNVCDECRDDEGAHALLTRTEAKSEFLLKDCDLDMRPPPLRCVRRPNPHRGARSDMRLYLRAQVEARAIEVWGSEEALELERAERDMKRVRTKQRADARRLRALRMDVRSSLFARNTGAHEHRWGAERYDADDDTYSHDCLECGHTETYEKM